MASIYCECPMTSGVWGYRCHLCFDYGFLCHWCGVHGCDCGDPVTQDDLRKIDDIISVEETIIIWNGEKQ